MYLLSIKFEGKPYLKPFNYLQMYNKNGKIVEKIANYYVTGLSSLLTKKNAWLWGPCES